MFTKYGHNLSQNIENVLVDENVIRKEIIGLGRMLFELTQNCNLICRYCIYRTQACYRRPSKKVLDFNTARRAIDYVYDLIKNRDKKDFLIGFYGGEPLINYELLKEIVDYSKRIYWAWNITFNMTTNGTLLNEDIIEYLVSNNMSILVSLDGPKEIHDNKRIYPNGTGSFNEIIHKLKYIKKQHNNYFHNKVRFSITWSRDLSILDIYNFFSYNDIVKNNSSVFSLVDDANYYKQYPYDISINNEELMSIKNIIDKKNSDGQELNRFEHTILNYLFERSDSIKDSLLKRTYNLARGTCLVNNMVYIDADGKYHMCHLMGTQYPIGNVWEGIDYSKTTKLVTDFVSIVKRHCIKCAIRSFCVPCYVFFSKAKKLSIEKDKCNLLFNKTVHSLNKYIEEKNKINIVTGDKIFHHFVHIEEGYKYSAIVDFLQNKVFHTENDTLKFFKKGLYEKIPMFVQSLQKENLIVDNKENLWNPYENIISQSISERSNSRTDTKIIIETESGSDIQEILRYFINYEIKKIVYYGSDIMLREISGISIEKRIKSFNLCIEKNRIAKKFRSFSYLSYMYNSQNNPCWGGKVAITKKEEIKPCIYSRIILGKLKRDSIEDVFPKILEYWSITKKKIEKCRDCEFRFLCSDCREIAFRENKNLYDSNPLCNYDPYSGNWQ